MACQNVLTSKVSLLGYEEFMNNNVHDMREDELNCGHSQNVECEECNELASNSELSETSCDMFEDSDCVEEVEITSAQASQTQTCYDHKDCPSAQITPIQLTQNEEAPIISVNLHKPVDFYMSYQTLVQGLDRASAL